MPRVADDVKAERRALVQGLYAQIEAEGRSDLGTNDVVTDLVPGELISVPLIALKALRADPALQTDEQIMAAAEGYGDTPETAWVPAMVRATMLKEQANEHFAAGMYPEAIDKYCAALRLVFKDAVDQMPSKVYRFKPYMDLVVRNAPPKWSPMVLVADYRWNDVLFTITVCNNMSQCYIKMGRYLEAIDWIMEAEQIMNAVPNEANDPPAPGWKTLYNTFAEFWIMRYKTWSRIIHIFGALGNTSALAGWGVTALIDIGTLPDSVSTKFPKVHAAKKDLKPLDWAKSRHPEANISIRTVSHPDLQVLGIWRKLAYAAGDLRPQGRMQACTWIWRGRLYVAVGFCVGEQGIHMQLDDFWRLDLITRSWRRLPDVPLKQIGRTMNNLPTGGTFGQTTSFRPWKDNAYCWVGSKQIAVFDLVKETWAVKQTRLTPGSSWPYKAKQLDAFCTAHLDGKLYAFGGDDGNCKLGNNILMALDLVSLKWEHLSGTSNLEPKRDEPGLREHAAIWAVPRQRKLYMMYGQAHRQRAFFDRAPHGAQTNHVYYDIWAFDIDVKRWEQLKLRGNYPGTRTEIAYTHSEKLGHSFVYGGYHQEMPTMGDPTFMFNYSYFSDTYMFDPETLLWKHILVRGFPSYRAASSLIVDEDTGKLFMYGGYVNSDFCPSRQDITRMHGDLWQLKIDIPDGHWDPRDLERDIRLERIGPWTMCFTCSTVSVDHQKCGGTCGGIARFCNAECQRAGWKEHKVKHQCRRA